MTHRCHGRAFLFRFANHRSEYCARLRIQSQCHRVSLLDYSLTSNHVHLVALADDPALISRFMHDLQGGFASHYNRIKHRSGAFWSDRFHCTLVNGADHLMNCLAYIDLNMVRAGVVGHPKDWPWCGYDEIAGLRRRYRILDIDRLLELAGHRSLGALAEAHQAAISDAIAAHRLERKSYWTQSIAVGDESFVRSISHQSRHRRRWVVLRNGDGSWHLNSNRKSRSE